MIKHYCDCCGKPLDDENWIRIEYKLIDINNTDAGGNKLIYDSAKRYSDFCQCCLDKIDKILNGGK